MITNFAPLRTICLSLVLTVLFVAYVWCGMSVAAIASVRSQFRLPGIATGQTKLPKISKDAISRAIWAAPINQSVFNAHIVMRANENSRSDVRASLMLLRKLGWRDPTSVQNMISNALVTQDLSDIAIAGDALLRQDVLVEEATGLMVLLEAYPETWAGIETRLASNVPWRYRYLERAGSLATDEQLDGRLKTLVALQRRGDRLQRQEVAPFVTLMVDKGRIAQSRALWLNHTGVKPDVLLDSDFVAAQKQSLLALPTTPFEWSFNGGLGFVADVATDGLNKARVAIQWDGRGVPVLMTQQTGAGPRRYRLHVRVDGEPINFSRTIGFRLRCGVETVGFSDGIIVGSDLVLTMHDKISCSFPTLDIFGKLQEPRRAVDVAFVSVRMEAVSE